MQGVVNLPEELKKLPQWAIAGPDGKGGNKAPHTLNTSGLLCRASVNAADKLLTFGTACEIQNALTVPSAIGFVLQNTDPYTCIDLDYKEGVTTVEQLERYQKIIDTFDSYTEVSVSGKGVHIWVKGAIGAGARRDGVEVYSQERFIICTGNVVIDKPIAYRQELLDILISEIREGESHLKFELQDTEDYFEDYEILELATNASNSEKFNMLCEGRWAELNYPSQSEADLSLMSMFAFYSTSNEQCRRLFRMTALGKREKATKNDRYLNYALTIIRSRQKMEQENAKRAEVLGIAIAQRLQHEEELKKQLVQQCTQTVPGPVAEITGLEQAEEGLPYPPGVAGDIARFIYGSSPRPVKEVSIVATIGLLAGICGKAFHIPQSGLNIYMILVARSAIGKESMHSGISHILTKLRESVPTASNFVNFADFASGPALVKACAENPSFVNVAGEWGKKLSRLSKEDRVDGPMQQLRTVMTNLYQKSGPGSIAGGMMYSNKDNNVVSVSGVAYSMIGETTPGTFYDALTESMMEDGFLSRFNIVEYNGDRPPANKKPVTTLTPSLAEKLSEIVVYASTLLARYQHCEVQFSPEAQHKIDLFDVECDTEINSTVEESWRQMWNRAHLKVCRLAALLAVADSHLHPVVKLEHLEWAMALVRRDIEIMSNRIKSGDVGIGDSTRERKIMSVIRTYLAKPLPETYGIPDTMRQLGIIPRRFIQLRISRVNCFTNHRAGATVAIDATLRSLCDSGYIMEIAKDKLESNYGYQGKCYRILNCDM